MSKLTLIFAALLVNCFWCCANSPYESSPFDERNFEPVFESIVGSPALLKVLAEKEEIIYILISQYYLDKSLNRSTTRENTVLDLAQSYITHFEATTGNLKLRLENEGDEVVYRANNVAWNPLSMYHLMRRFLGTLKEFVRHLDPKNERDYALQKQIRHVMKSLGWPSLLDLMEVMAAILRIQHVYDLSTADIASGFLNGINTGIVMTAYDCNAIGMHAMETKYYALAVEWLELSVVLFHHYHNIPVYEVKTYVQKNLQKDFETAIEMHDHMYEVGESWEPLFFYYKVNSGEKWIRRRTTLLENSKGRREDNYNDINYWGVCSGENYQTEKDKSKLFCWYETKAHAYWKINPLKAELLSFNPLQVVQFYDLISSEMINKIKQNAMPHLMKSTTVDEETKDGIISESRTSWNSWIEDTSLPEFQSIPRTVELITGLEVGVESSQDLQVATYSSGSHYVTHLDASNPTSDVPGGDRIATFIYYLSDVGKGGGTAFPQSGIATVPKKGSAVFWYNLEPSGEANWNSWHGSCPVILGEKWIANKWILSHDQMFTPGHKCLGDHHAFFDIKVNGVALRELVL